MKAVLALDQGTTSCRAIAFDRRGIPMAIAQREFRQIYPQPGWVEHDPAEIFETQRDVAAQALAEAGLKAGDVAAFGIANQRETTVLWERDSGRPVANAIVWQDRRTASHCDVLREAGHEALLASRTGLLLDPYFSGTKLAWLLDNTPGARSRAERGELAFGTVDAWLAWHLTGGREHVTDVSNASRTLLFNIHDLDWDDELLGLFGIPRAVLPRVAAYGEVMGRTRCAGLPEGIPIAGMAGDQHAALFGQACHQPGLAKNTYGTGCFLLMNTGLVPARSQNRLLTTVAWRREASAHYALEGSVFIGGAAVQWLRDGLGIISSSAEVGPLAATVQDSGGVHFVPALSGLGSPYWDPRARGTIVGLTRGSTKAHLARATLEAIAFQTVELLAAMAADAGIAPAELRVDGGATANDLLMQIQADLLGIPVVRPRVTETTALGAAYLAGLAVGFWEDEPEIAALWARDRVFDPAIGAGEAAERLAAWRRAVARARDWATD